MMVLVSLSAMLTLLIMCVLSLLLLVLNLYVLCCVIAVVGDTRGAGVYRCGVDIATVVGSVDSIGGVVVAVIGVALIAVGVGVRVGIVLSVSCCC